MKGFTLFFAILIASLALSVGLAIYDLTIRELDLSATATQSQYAIYAADTGAECALDWDKKGFFATSSDSGTGMFNIRCNNQNIQTGLPNNPPTPWTVTTTSGGATTNFTLTFLPQQYCANVTVTKVGHPPATTIVSDGFNTCAGNGSLQLERVFQVSY